MATDQFKDTQDKFKNQNLRKVWQVMKTKAIAEMTKFDPKGAKELAAKFDKGLGPLLDKWDKETSTFPKLDTKKLGAVGADVAKVMATYKKGSPGGKAGMIIDATIDGIAGEMKRRQQWYAEVLKKA